MRHSRLLGKHQVARWERPAAQLAGREGAAQGPPRFDPTYLARAGDVEARPLDFYEVAP